MNSDIKSKRKPEYVAGVRTFYPQEIRFEDEMLIDGHHLNFYIPICFDPAVVFGPKLQIAEGGGYVNVYANYDLDKGCVCDALEIVKVLYDGSESNYEYRLSNEEKAWIQERMEHYHFAGDTLQTIRREYEAEKNSVLSKLAAAKTEGQAPLETKKPKIHEPEH